MVSSGGDVLDRLSRSQIYRDYEQAFTSATHLPLALRPPEVQALVHQDRPHENPFCAMLARKNRTCEACLAMQKKIARPDANQAVTATCFAGLSDTAVPVRVGPQLIGFLQTGQVSLTPPTATRFSRIAAQLVEWGTQVDLRRLEDAYYHSHILSPEQYTGMVHLLEIFAGHLSTLGHQLVLQEATAESPFARRAKAYVAEHHGDPITLEDMARTLHMSTYYFCKMFKKATGLTFTDYLSRVRVERAKDLLLDPHLRISEVAFQVGFGSLTHFNRIFRKVEGLSPTAYRNAQATRPLA